MLTNGCATLYNRWEEEDAEQCIRTVLPAVFWQGEAQGGFTGRRYSKTAAPYPGPSPPPPGRRPCAHPGGYAKSVPWHPPFPTEKYPASFGKRGGTFGGILSKNIISILSRRVKIYIFPEMVVIFRHSSGIINVLWPCAMIPPFFTALSSSLRGRREARPMGLCPYPCEKFHTGGDPHGCMRPDL